MKDEADYNFNSRAHLTRINMRIRTNIPYQHISAQVILSAIEAELHRLKITDISINENRLSFRNAMFNEIKSSHLMNPVDRGYFKVETDRQRLTYSYSTKKMLLITLAMSVFIGFLSQMPIVGMIAFMWLFGGNWVIALIRHHLFMRRLIKKVIPDYNNAVTANQSA